MTTAQAAGHQPPQAVRPETWSLPRALKLLDDHRCACLRCPGSTATCEWPSWRRCEECGCMWKSTEIRGRRYAETVESPSCRANEPEEETP